MDLIQWTGGRDSQLNPGTRVLKRHVSASDSYRINQLNAWEELDGENTPHTYYCFKSFVTNGQCFREEVRSRLQVTLSSHIWQWSDFIHTNHSSLEARGAKRWLIHYLSACWARKKSIYSLKAKEPAWKELISLMMYLQKPVRRTYIYHFDVLIHEWSWSGEKDV